MSKLVECVPNFSEGRDRTKIDAIVDAVRKVPGVSVLDVDPGSSTNRTVLTFVGSPDAVVEGALACARKCYELIDMSVQHGEHPRNGALDVCPFVPVANVTMEECANLARIFGKRLAEELDVPVFLYEEAQTDPKMAYLRLSSRSVLVSTKLFVTSLRITQISGLPILVLASLYLAGVLLRPVLVSS